MKKKLLAGLLTSTLIISSGLWLLPTVDALNYGEGLYGECLYGGEISDDALDVNVTTPSADLGTLNSASAATSTAAFDVTLACSESGYSVQILGTAPTGSAHTLSALATPTASSSGTEQFGINLVDNTNPNVGANPSGGSGSAASGYGTADLFKFVSGDVIAEASASSATTSYTISFLANISSVTPASDYEADYTIVCVATY